VTFEAGSKLLVPLQNSGIRTEQILLFAISSQWKRGLEEGELCEESAREKLIADPLRAGGKKSRSKRRIHSESIGFDKGYQEANWKAKPAVSTKVSTKGSRNASKRRKKKALAPRSADAAAAAAAAAPHHRWAAVAAVAAVAASASASAAAAAAAAAAAPHHRLAVMAEAVADEVRMTLPLHPEQTSRLAPQAGALRAGQSTAPGRVCPWTPRLVRRRY
jgi:transposase